MVYRSHGVTRAVWARRAEIHDSREKNVTSELSLIGLWAVDECSTLTL